MPVTPIDPPVARRHPVEPAPPAPTFGSAMATVGHVSRAGRWIMPRRFRAVAWMGGIDLDLTDAVIPPEGAVLELLAVLGVITVRIPAGLPVELLGDAITWTAAPGWAPVRGDAPRSSRAGVSLVGRAVLGKVHVCVVPTATPDAA